MPMELIQRLSGYGLIIAGTILIKMAICLLAGSLSIIPGIILKKMREVNKGKCA